MPPLAAQGRPSPTDDLDDELLGEIKSEQRAAPARSARPRPPGQHHRLLRPGRAGQPDASCTALHPAPATTSLAQIGGGRSGSIRPHGMAGLPFDLALLAHAAPQQSGSIPRTIRLKIMPRHDMLHPASLIWINADGRGGGCGGGIRRSSSRTCRERCSSACSAGGGR